MIIASAYNVTGEEVAESDLSNTLRAFGIGTWLLILFCLILFAGFLRARSFLICILLHKKQSR